jgi:hypothetical protein
MSNENILPASQWCDEKSPRYKKNRLQLLIDIADNMLWQLDCLKINIGGNIYENGCQ